MKKADSQEIMAPAADSSKMLRAMVGLGVICALMIVLAFEWTKPRIEQNKAAALEKAIFKVIPGMVSKQTFLLTPANTLVQAGASIDKNAEVVYAGYDQEGKLAGIAVEASGLGFADVLRVLYGYNPATEKIVGFFVLESKETPGLGDKIEKDPQFLANFAGLDVALKDDKATLKNPPVTVKAGMKTNPWEIDGITGATISSRAIGAIINSSTTRWVPMLQQQQATLRNTTIN